MREDADPGEDRGGGHDDLGPALGVEHGDFLISIDGETQRLAWARAAQAHPQLLQRRVAVVVHHGLALTAARQGFYDLNTREVKHRQPRREPAGPRAPAFPKLTRMLLGEFTPAGRFSIGGPKEVGHTVAKALRDPNSDVGKRVRGEE